MHGEISVVMTFAKIFVKFYQLIKKLVGVHAWTYAHTAPEPMSLLETVPNGLSTLKHSEGQQL
jgi:hypothetical protein